MSFPAFRYRYNLSKKELLEKGAKKVEEAKKILRTVEEERKKVEEKVKNMTKGD